MPKAKIVRGLSVAMVLVVAIVAALPLSAAPANAPALEQPTPNVRGNLLVNPGFESPFVKQCCHTEAEFPPNTPIDEVQVPQGWSGWWRSPDSAPQYPSRCDVKDAPPNCIAFHRPEWREAAPYADRIRTGLNAQKYFTFWSIHEAGMFQRVTGVRPGQRLQFAVYMMAWSTEKAEVPLSAGQQTMNLKVGIDPYGGADPFSPKIVWSKPWDSYDVYSQFSVEAVAQSNAVTVFTYSRPIYPLQHNDMYVDDAALVVVGSGAVAPAPGGSTGGSGSTTSNIVPGPYPGTTLDKKTGNILYVVQPGDTTWSISQRFNTTVNSIVAWNNLQSAEFIRLGRTLIVGKTKR
ncbi:MAG TPA: LysM domain-containing protein [Anaerolineales bacterium]|nr:LysM domain-containing protein [Anaerolineales bacterium]